jgi:hypothetical protein
MHRRLILIRRSPILVTHGLLPSGPSASHIDFAIVMGARVRPANDNQVVETFRKNL